MFKFLKKKIKKIEDKAEEEKENKIFGLSDKKIDELLWELEMDMLESDVALETVDYIKSIVKKNLVGSPRKEAKKKIEEALKEAINNILKKSEKDFYF